MAIGERNGTTLVMAISRQSIPIIGVRLSLPLMINHHRAIVYALFVFLDEHENLRGLLDLCVSGFDVGIPARRPRNIRIGFWEATSQSRTVESKPPEIRYRPSFENWTDATGQRACPARSDLPDSRE
jgi:hypothetical protein